VTSYVKGGWGLIPGSRHFFLFSRCYMQWAERETSCHLLLVPTFRMRGSFPLRSPYITVARCLFHLAFNFINLNILQTLMYFCNFIM
jgi:hypothetical protein